MGAERRGTPAGTVAVQPATHARLRDAADVLLLACVDDPALATLLPVGASRREERLHLMFLAELHLAGTDRVDVAVNTLTDQVVGVAVWQGPPRADAAGPSPADTARWAVVAATALGPGGVLAGRRQDRAAVRVRPPEPHWHLLDVAVDPLTHGCGIGTALLRHRLTQVDAQAKRSFLCATTASSQRLYARHGFVATPRLPSAVGGATPMVRRPVIRI